jgi:hypothetical protein
MRRSSLRLGPSLWSLLLPQVRCPPVTSFTPHPPRQMIRWPLSTLRHGQMLRKMWSVGLTWCLATRTFAHPNHLIYIASGRDGVTAIAPMMNPTATTTSLPWRQKRKVDVRYVYMAHRHIIYLILCLLATWLRLRPGG